MLEVFSNFFLLNLIWLLVCLPLVTSYPATAAMFGVVREWVKGREPRLLESFFSFFRESLKQSLLIGIVWTLMCIFLVSNFFLVGQLPPSAKFPLYMWFIILGFIYLLASIYLFPVMVNYELRWAGVLKNSLLLSVSQLLVTLQCMLVLGTSTVLLLAFPPVLLMIGSVTSYALYWLCERAFQRVAARENETA